MKSIYFAHLIEMCNLSQNGRHLFKLTSASRCNDPFLPRISQRQSVRPYVFRSEPLQYAAHQCMSDRNCCVMLHALLRQDKKACSSQIEISSPVSVLYVLLNSAVQRLALKFHVPEVPDLSLLPEIGSSGLFGSTQSLQKCFLV